jgi:uncharacterized protein (TIGR02271 family)
MITTEQLRDVVGATAYDGSGDKIGKVGNVYHDDDTDQPTWLTVHTGLFGGNETFVPLQGADLSGDGRVTVAYDKAVVKDAPHIEENGHLSPQQEQQLYRYYDLDDSAGIDSTGQTDTVDRTDGEFDGRHSARQDNTEGVFDGRGQTPVGQDTSGPVTDAAMTRSEEQLRVGTQTREAGRARLRKRVVTETEQATVPVSHEELTIEREPITEDNRGDAYDGPAISQEEHEVVLREERPVVATETVAVERVRMGTDTVQDQHTVTGEVRKEVIDVDDDTVHGVRDDRDDVRDERS